MVAAVKGAEMALVHLVKIVSNGIPTKPAKSQLKLKVSRSRNPRLEVVVSAPGSEPAS